MNSNPSQNQPPEGASIGSSQNSSHYRQGLDNNKYYTEDERLQQAVKLYSTLQDKDHTYQEDVAASFQDNDVQSSSQRKIRMKQNQSDQIYGNNNDNADSTSTVHVFSKIQTSITRRLFKMNHILLENQVVTPPVYHLLIFVEFLQIIFFVLNHVDVINEFKAISQTSYSMDTSISNSSSLNLFSTNQSETGYTISEQDVALFSLNDVLKFFVFPVLVLEQGSTHNYLLLLIIFNAIFIFASIWLLLFANKIYVEQLNGAGGLKDGSKMLVKGVSIIITLFLTVFQVPMFLLYFQAFLCDENIDNNMVLDIECGSKEQRLLTSISCLALVLFTIFTLSQKLLFTTSNYETTLPWGSLNLKYDLLGTLLKIVLSAAFIFDKNNLYHLIGYLHIACFLYSFVILYKRVSSGIVINKSAYQATLIYETLLMWMFLTIGCHILSTNEGSKPHGETLYISTLMVMFLTGLILGVALVILQEFRSNRIVIDDKPHSHLTSPQDYHQYFFKLFTLISHHHFDRSASMVLSGHLSNHMKDCVDEICLCAALVASKLDHIEQIQENIKELERGGSDNKREAINSKKEEIEVKSLTSMIEILSSEKRNDNNFGNIFNNFETSNQQHQQMKVAELEKHLRSQNTEHHKNRDSEDDNKRQFIENKQNNLLHTKRKIDYSALEPEQNKYQPEGLTRQGTVKMQPETTNSQRLNIKNPSSETLASTNLKAGRKNNQITKLNFDQNNSKSQIKIANNMTEELSNNTENQRVNAQQTNREDYNSEEFEQVNVIAPAKSKHWFLYLAFNVQNALKLFPKRVDLRIVNSFLQQAKLKNNFKATFELMNCELLSPDLQERFTIFRMKFDIEQQLIAQNEKNNQTSGCIDALQIYQYEKLFQRYSLLEYLTATSTLNFWRELLQKSVSTIIIKIRGAEISLNYAKIEDIAHNLLKINSNDIKFLYRYALFQKQIACNDQEAILMFEKIFILFTSKANKKSNQSGEIEISCFGENSAPAIIMISTNSHQIGHIIYANQEISHILNFSPIDVIGRNVSCLMPNIIGEHHDQFIVNYMETAKSHVINNMYTTFGVNKEGFLKPIKLLIKIYPHLSGKIVFIGMIQQCEINEDIIQGSNSELETVNHQYIITNEKGAISSVTDGLSYDFGLNPKFFGYNGNKNASHFQFSINISMICPDINDAYPEEVLENDGAVLTFDTRELLNHVDLEALSHEEVIDIQQKLGIYQAQVQMKKIQYQNALVCIYKVSPVVNNSDMPSMNLVNSKNIRTDNFENADRFKQSNSIDPLGKMDLEQPEEDPNSSIREFDLSSTTSTSTTTGTLKSSINDFKRALSERKSSKSLRRLNLIIFILVLAFVSLACSEYAITVKLIKDLDFSCEHSLQSLMREILYILLTTNIRTLVNIGNHVEPTRYEGETMKDVDRFHYLSQLIQKQADSLQETVDFIDAQRQDSSSYNPTVFANFEKREIALYRLDQNNQIFKYKLPYRQAFSTYLDFIQLLNGATEANMSLPGFLIRGSPPADLSTVFAETTAEEKYISYLILNGYRNLLEMTFESNDLQQEKSFNDTMDDHFLVIMILGILVSAASMIVIFHHIWMMEKVKGDILSLFALLNLKEIKRVFDDCDKYIDKLEEFQQGRSGVLSADQNLNDTVNVPNSKIFSMVGSQFASIVSKDRINVQSRQDLKLDQYSEDAKEDETAFQAYAQKIKAQRQREAFLKKNQRFIGEVFYDPIIRDIKDEIRDIQEKEAAFQQKKDQNAQKQVQQQRIFNNSQAVLLQKDDMTERELLDDQGITPSVKRSKQTLSKFGQKKRKHNNRSKFNNSIVKMNPIKKNIDFGMEEDESHDSSRQEEDSAQNHRQKSKSSEKKAKKSAGNLKEVEKENEPQDVLEHRKRMFAQQNQLGSIRLMVACSIFGMIILAYFVYIYSYHQEQMSEIKHLNEQLPLFFNRYTDIVLAYAFLREKIINNNSLSTFNLDKTYFKSNTSIDSLFKNLALKNEKELSNEKTRSPSLLTPITDFMNIIDSEQFCSKVIGEYADLIVEKASSTKITQKELAQIKKQAYSFEIQTVIAACIAALEGDIATLRRLFQEGVDLGKGNYDRRTPLHIACSMGKFEVVQFLVEEAKVDVNPLDRWDSSPLSDAQPYPEIARYLVKKGGVLRKVFPPVPKFEVNVSTDQYRLYYAAYYGDVQMMERLKYIGWELNAQDFDGRTALGIAASEGRLEAVKFLINEEADLSIVDEKGNDPLDDAVRENRTSTVIYLKSIINEQLIKHACSMFQDGILVKGIQQAFGIFFKKQEDIQIAVSNTTNYHQLIQYLNPEITAEQASQIIKIKGKPISQSNSSTPVFSLTNYTSTQRGMNTFISTVEVYFYRIIDRLENVVRVTTSQFVENYNLTSESVFFVFIAYQVLILLVFRKRLLYILKSEVFQSRGILNLIPWAFFEENREAFLSIVAKLKD